MSYNFVIRKNKRTAIQMISFTKKKQKKTLTNNSLLALIVELLELLWDKSSLTGDLLPEVFDLFARLEAIFTRRKKEYLKVK